MFLAICNEFRSNLKFMMMIQAKFTRIVELFQLPFMQRALMGSVLTGLMGGLLGSFIVLRQLSFFSDTLRHSALLGISIGLLLGLNLSWVLLPFAVLFALLVTYFLERTQLWTNALLNIVYSSSLALGIILLSFRDEYKGGITHLLVGDILAVQTTGLIFSALLLVVCVTFIVLTLHRKFSSPCMNRWPRPWGCLFQPNAPPSLCCFPWWLASPLRRSVSFLSVPLW